MQEMDTEIEQFIQEGVREVMEEMDRVGQEAVRINVENGDYRNRTGNLRRSNYYEVDQTGLTIGNSADYAGDVEARGYMVCSEGALYAERELNAGD